MERHSPFHVSGLDLASKIWGELRTGAWSGTQEVRKLNTSAQDIATIVGVGGNLGIFAAIGYRLLRKQGFRCVRILTIEPLPESYLVLKWNLWQNGVLESPPGTLNADDVAGAGGVPNGHEGAPVVRRPGSQPRADERAPGRRASSLARAR